MMALRMAEQLCADRRRPTTEVPKMVITEVMLQEIRKHQL